MKQTLRRRWNNLFPDASIERSQYTFQLIWGHYNDGLRDYHTLEHIASALEALDAHFPNAPRATELAIWLHDLIYIPGDSRNEEMSAHFGAYILAYLDESPAIIEAAHDAIRATELTFDDEFMARLDAIFPGPGGEAPKAYAW